jgi:hypothetical protein
MIFTPFRAHLTRHLEADDNTLPLDQRDETRLLANLQAEGETQLLVVRDDRHEEEIEAGILCGKLVVLRRGVGGTRARRFPRGAEVVFRVTVEAVRRLICSWDCCTGDPCPCAPVEGVSATVPAGAHVGQPVTIPFVFSGDLPLVMSWEAPHWLGAERDATTVEFRGVPAAPGDYEVAVTASNCRGHHSVTRRVQFSVSA